MFKDVVRVIGTACILTGIALHFLNTTTIGTEASKENLEAEVLHLQQQLQKTEEALADLQQTSASAKKPATEQEENEQTSDSTKETKEEKSTAITLAIEEGDNSTIVANKLAESGLIGDAKLFETYLVENNLTQKIQVGEYELNNTMSRKEIASIITS